MKNFLKSRNGKKCQKYKWHFCYLLFFVVNSLLAQQPPVPPCSGDHCNMYCQNDFEAFLPMANAYYPQSGLVQFQFDDCFAVGLNPNTVDIVVDNIDDPLNPNPNLPHNQFACFGSANIGCEGLYIPLEEGVPPGCFLMFEFRGGTESTTVPRFIDFFGSTNPPCNIIDDNFNCGTTNPLCLSYLPHCIQTGIPLNQYAGASTVLPVTDPNHPYPQFGESYIYFPNEAQLEDKCIVWENTTNDVINFITIFSQATKIYLDDIFITRYCSDLLSVTSTATNQWCSNDGTNTIEYQVCVDAEACDAPMIDMQASFPPTTGVSFGTGGNFSQSGAYSTPIDPNGCVTVTLEIALDQNLITSDINNLDITMDVTLTEGCYVENEQDVNSVTIIVNPDATFDFDLPPCSAEVTFTSNGDPADIHLWEFGDPINSQSTDANPVHDYVYFIPETFTVTHTVNNGCTSTETTDITIDDWRPYPDFTFNVDCSPLDATVTFTSVAQALLNTHSWIFGDGGTSTAANPVHDYLMNGTYSVTHVVTDECGNTDIEIQQVVIECAGLGFDCPCTGANSINIDAGNGTEIGQTALPPGMLNNFSGCLAIGGKLIVNEDYKISSGEVRMQPGAEIVVTNGAELTLINIVANGGLHGCEIMWKGIRVEPGGKLRSLFNIIQDAQSAVSASSGSSFASLEIISTLFDRNHIGISILPKSPAPLQTIHQPLPLGGNIFTTSAPLLPPFEQLFGYDQTYGYAGIKAENAVFFVGGFSAASASPNDFNNLRNGIVASNSLMGIFGANFTDIKGSVVGYETIDFSEGVGVYLSDCNSSTVEECTFENMEIGIRTWQTGLKAKLNSTSKVAYGIWDWNPNFRDTDIRHNTIKARKTGIYCLNVDAPFEFIVHDNPVTMETKLGGPIGGSGIYIGGMAQGSVGTGNTVAISENPITLKNDRFYGMLIHTIKDFPIFGNDIFYDANAPTAPGPAAFIFSGLDLQTADDNYLYDNYVNSNLPLDLIHGISLHGSEMNEVCCNTVNNANTGVYFSGQCDMTELRHTSIGSHQEGLLCIAGTTIGDQEDAGNTWDGSYSSHGASHLGDNAEVAGSEFKVELPMSSTYWPSGTPNVPYSNVSWFIPSGGNANDCIECPEPPEVGYEDDDDGINDNDITVVDGGFDSSPYGDMLTFEGSRTLFKRLEENPQMLGQYPQIDSFHQAASGNNIGLFHDVEEQIGLAFSVDSSIGLQVNLHRQYIDSLLMELKEVDSLLQIAQNAADSSQLMQQGIALQAQFSPHASYMRDMTDSLEVGVRSIADAIITDNGNISTSSVIEANRKLVTGVYLETAMKGIFELNTSQVGDLEGVIWQCPLEGGDAVYWARLLYRMHNDTLLFNDDALCATANFGGNGGGQLITSPVSGSALVLAPNPVNNEMKVSFSGENDETVSHLVITGLDGKILLYEPWRFMSHTVTVSTAGLPNGVYLCTLFDGDERLASKKLVVIH